jgi:hypothetical protein
MFADEVVRLTATALVRERRVADRIETTSILLRGATLGALATFAGADLDAPLSVGHDTPALVDPAAPMDVDTSSAAVITAWFGAAAEVLDDVIATRPGADATAVQLWPEHFDLAVDVLVARGRVNLGASPGDSFCDEPYLYVGPWDAQRPGNASFWNAPFGAVLRHHDIVAAGPTPRAAMHEFWLQGLALLGDPPGNGAGADD